MITTIKSITSKVTDFYKKLSQKNTCIHRLLFICWFCFAIIKQVLLELEFSFDNCSSSSNVESSNFHVETFLVRLGRNYYEKSFVENISFPTLIVKGNKYGTCTRACTFSKISVCTEIRSLSVTFEERESQLLSRTWKQIAEYFNPAIVNERSTEICRRRWKMARHEQNCDSSRIGECRGSITKITTKHRERRHKQRWMKIPLTSRRRVTIAPRGRLPSRNLLSPIFSKFHLGSSRAFPRFFARLEYIQPRVRDERRLWCLFEVASCGRWPKQRIETGSGTFWQFRFVYRRFPLLDPRGEPRDRNAFLS